jgi:phosphoglycolate phosphatase
MKTYQNILFDLDGTLTDPAIGITNSVEYALNKFNIQTKEKSELYKFIGPPLQDSFEILYNFSKDEAVKAVKYYREYYSYKGIYENYVYAGIEDLLKNLLTYNKTLIVATSKPEYYAKKILAHFCISKHFTFIAGSKMDGTRVRKSEVIAYALDQLKIADKEKTIMIGDREHDIVGAYNQGIDSMGVLYGYGSKEELVQAGAKYIAQSVLDIGDFLVNQAH